MLKPIMKAASGRPAWLMTLGGAICTLLLLGAAGEMVASAHQKSPYAEFPLDKDVVGGGPSVTLDEGQLPNKTNWGVYASRVGAGRRGYQQPCISLARITVAGEYGAVHGCGPLTPSSGQDVPNYVYIAGSYQSKPGGPFIGESILGLSLSPKVYSAALIYAGGGQARRRTQLFNAKQQAKTKLAPFRYIAFAVQDDVCADTVVGYAKHGSQLFSAKTGLC